MPGNSSNPRHRNNCIIWQHAKYSLLVTKGYPNMTRSYVPTRRDVSILLLESLATPATAAVSKPRRSEIERLRGYAEADAIAKGEQYGVR